MGITKGLALLCLIASVPMSAQETRSMLFGKVLDPQGAFITGASVILRNAETGVTQSIKSNDKGYYEGNLLMPGNYEIIAEVKGFKKLIRQGITLPVASRIQVDMAMEVGGVTETICLLAVLCG